MDELMRRFHSPEGTALLKDLSDKVNLLLEELKKDDSCKDIENLHEEGLRATRDTMNMNKK